MVLVGNTQEQWRFSFIAITESLFSTIKFLRTKNYTKNLAKTMLIVNKNKTLSKKL